MAPGLETVIAAWAILSGLGVAALGILSLLGGRSRPWGALPLGLFAVTWSAHIVFGNAPSLVEDLATARWLVLGTLVSLFPLPYFLVEFTREQTGSESRNRAWQALRAVTAFVAIGSALTFAVSPGVFLQRVEETAAGVVASWGPGFTLLQALFLATLGLALFALFRGLETAATPRVAHRLAFLFTGLGVYVAYTAGRYATFYGTWILEFGTTSRNVPFFVLFLVLSAVVGYLVVATDRKADSVSPPDLARRYRTATWALLLPAVWGLGEGYVALMHAPRLDTVGVWRLVGLGIVTYGIVRWRVFDLPRRTRRAAASSAGATGAVAGGATAYGAASLATTTIAFPLAAGTLVTAVGLAPAIRYARELLGVDDEQTDDGSTPELYGEKVDAYRAALEASIARGTLDEDEEFLQSLRERFGLGEEADQVLRHLAHEAVVVPSGERLEGTYERLRLLGEGGSSRAWLARDRARERLVVLKEPVSRWQSDEALLDRVLREARAMARIDHPNVVRVHEVVDDDGLPVLVMEYVDGGSLRDRLRSKGVLDWQRALDVASDLLAGLAALHAAGLLHRDLKPANVLLTGSGRAKVGDLGVAQAAGGGDTVVDADDPTPGTPTYMAPEVRAGQPHTEASDVYACGAVLYEALYGSPPAPEGTVRAENEVPEPLKAAVAKATAQDPSARYESAEAFRQAIEEVRPS